MDVRPSGRIHPVIAKVVPGLAMEPGADLHDAHIVISVTEPEPADLAEMLEDHPRAEAEPAQDRDQDPPAPDELERALLPFLRLALRHFSGSSRSTFKGKQPGHGEQIKLSQ